MSIRVTRSFRLVVAAAISIVLAGPLGAVIMSEASPAFRVRGFHHYSLPDSPISGPVEVIANTNHTEVSRGALMDVFLAVQNHSNTATTTVVVSLSLNYGDGELVIPFSLGAMRTHTLGPDEGVGFFIFWVIPEDAPLGTGTFTVTARIAQLSGGDGHQNYDNPMVAADSVTFEVVP
jgi:hypothetical protein